MLTIATWASFTPLYCPMVNTLSWDHEEESHVDFMCHFRLGLEGREHERIKLWGQDQESDQRKYPSYTSKTPLLT